MGRLHETFFVEIGTVEKLRVVTIQKYQDRRNLIDIRRETDKRRLHPQTVFFYHDINKTCLIISDTYVLRVRSRLLPHSNS